MSTRTPKLGNGSLCPEVVPIEMGVVHFEIID